MERRRRLAWRVCVRLDLRINLATICLLVIKELYMIFFKHLGNLLKEFAGFAWKNKVWWIVPMVLVLLLLALLIVTGQTAAPFIYTLF